MSSGWMRAGLGLLLAALVATLFFARSENLEWREDAGASPYAGDFIHEYSTAWIVREDPTRLYDLATVHAVQHDRARMGFEWDRDRVNVPYYPPAYYSLLVPLTRLDYPSAARLWIGLQLLALAAAVGLLVRAHPVLVGWLPWALPLLLVFPPVTTGLVSGQKGPLWLFVFVATYALMRRGRSFAAGAVFGLMLLKPPLAVVLGAAMLARRDWRFLAGAAATAGALAGISWAVLGPDTAETWARWLESVRSPVAHDRPELLGQAHCWLGFARVALDAYGGAPVLALTLGLDLLTLGALWRLGGERLDPRSDAFAAVFAALVVATLLVSPHVYPYDLALLVAVFAIAGSELATVEGRTAGEGVWLRRTLLGVFLTVTLVTTTKAPAALLLSVPVCFALELLLLRRAGARGAPSRA